MSSTETCCQMRRTQLSSRGAHQGLQDLQTEVKICQDVFLHLKDTMIAKENG